MRRPSSFKSQNLKSCRAQTEEGQPLQRFFRFAGVVLEVCSANRHALPQFFANIERGIVRCLQRAGIDPIAASTPRLAALRISIAFIEMPVCL